MYILVTTYPFTFECFHDQQGPQNSCENTPPESTKMASPLFRRASSVLSESLVMVHAQNNDHDITIPAINGCVDQPHTLVLVIKPIITHSADTQSLTPSIAKVQVYSPTLVKKVYQS